MSKAGLVIIFNHKYEKNIPMLKKIYGERFSEIVFIMPFYNGKQKDVFSVYESSFCFEGYIAQACNRILEMQCDHYVFIGDDLLLNPLFRENNILSELKVNKHDAFIESLTPLRETEWPYDRFDQAYRAFMNPAVNFKSEIPTLEEAIKKSQQYGWNDISINHSVRTRPYKLTYVRRNIDKIYNKVLHPIDLDYPLVTGYSDFLIIPREKMVQYCHLMGVFAAMGLHAEIAIPTGLMLLFTPHELRTQKDVQYKTEKMWMPNPIASEFEKECNFDTDNIEKYWPEGYAYVHPVKLSKWK